MSEQIKVNPTENLPLPSDLSTMEQPGTPERPSSQEAAAPSSSAPATATTITPTQPSPTTVSPEAQRLADIERILEEDLADLYGKLPPPAQEKFRVTGEATARQINTLLSATTIQLKKIVEAIRSWLSLIPGVSKYFLEQEAKIKADRLVKLHDQQ